MKDQLRAWLHTTLRHLDVDAVMQPAIAPVRAVALGAGKVLVLAYGKAARAMASALVRGLPGMRIRGLVAVPAPDEAPLPPLEVIAGGHPVPTAGSLRAGRRALELAQSVEADEVVVFLASGGGSAVLEWPLDDAMTLPEIQTVHRTLIACGADIVAINTVRKHVSAVKGGRLAAAARHARAHLTIEINDVPERAGAVVASGPSQNDASTLSECRAVLDQFALWAQMPGRVQERLRRSAVEPDPTWHLSSDQPRVFLTVACNRLARHSLRDQLLAAGVFVVDDMSPDDLPYEQAAQRLLHRLDRLRRRHRGRLVAIVSGGELSVPLPANCGLGGRNQQFALACARAIRGQPITVLSCGTDGIDGNCIAAGALVDGSTMARARRAHFDVHDHLQRCDAFPLLHALGDTVITGPTGTNVRDVRLLVHSG